MSDILTEEEQKGARKTLTAAAMTYVAAVAVAAAQLLRLVLIFGGGGRLNKTAKAQLKDLGFIIEEDGPHYKIIFHDPRYMFTVSKTPSDHREGKNMISQIRAVIDVNKKI